MGSTITGMGTLSQVQDIMKQLQRDIACSLISQKYALRLRALNGLTSLIILICSLRLSGPKQTWSTCRCCATRQGFRQRNYFSFSPQETLEIGSVHEVGSLPVYFNGKICSRVVFLHLSCVKHWQKLHVLCQTLNSCSFIL